MWQTCRKFSLRFHKVVENLISFFCDFRCLFDTKCYKGQATAYFRRAKNLNNLLQNISAINILEHSKILRTDAQNYVMHLRSNGTEFQNGRLFVIKLFREIHINYEKKRPE
jgi:hypothetical protein